MIYTDVVVSVIGKRNEVTTSISNPILLFRGDRNLEISFQIEQQKFKFAKSDNMILTTNASFGQLVIEKPDGSKVLSDIAECDDGKIIFVITKDMIDELDEVGYYDIQIRLYDSLKNARVTIPVITNAIEVREPLDVGDSDPLLADAKIDEGMIDNSKIAISDPITEDEHFDVDGNYIQTMWNKGDLITQGKMNKIESALSIINAKAKNQSGGEVGDGEVGDLELRLKDDLSDTEDPSVKLAKAVINEILNKPSAKEYIITYKYLCDGVHIKADDTETVEEGITKIFDLANATELDGYEVSNVSPKSATINSDITVTYEYIKICVHVYNEAITKQATCTEKGIKTYTCEECGHSYTEEIPMLEHKYNEVITQAATCKQTGILTHTCEECGHNYTEIIPKEQHDYINDICTKCGEHVHEYIETITKQATCTEKGIKTYTCKLCEDSYTEEIPILPHEYADGICIHCGNSEFPIHPTYNEIELTSLFDFTQYPNSLMGSGGSSTINKKTSIYFDSAVIDVSKYAGQKLRIKMPAYTSSSGGSSFGRTCLVSSNENSPAWVQDLHVYELSPTGASASGQLIEYFIEIPANAQYLWTSKFNQAALEKGIGTDDFYCTIFKDILCTNISLNKTSLSFSDRNDQTLSVSVTPSDTTQKIIWSSSDKNVAMVENGTITPINNGECIITVICGAQSATCLIEVNINEEILDITDLFDFAIYPKMIMNTSTETGNSGTWKSSIYFDSAVVDLSAYAGKTILITIPAYNSSTGKNSCNISCLVNDNYTVGSQPRLKRILHRWESYSDDTSDKAIGEYREYIIELPSDTKYFLTTIFNPDALDKCVGGTEFYCRVLSHTHTHDYVETITKEATCIEDGIKTFKCQDCDDSYTENIPMLGHDYVNDKCVRCDSSIVTIDISHLFDFTMYPNKVMNAGSIDGKIAAMKDSTYFDSALADVTEYAGKTILMTVPAYNSSTGINSCNTVCQTTGGGGFMRILHRWEVYSDDTSIKSAGELRVYKITLPTDVNHIFTSIFNQTALDAGIGETGFYCKVIM